MAGRHRGIDARFQVSQAAQCTDDAPADRLHHRSNVRIAGRLALDKARLEARFGPIEVDALQEDAMEMEIQIDNTPETLDKRDRPRLDLVPWDPRVTAWFT